MSSRNSTVNYRLIYNRGIKSRVIYAGGKLESALDVATEHLRGKGETWSGDAVGMEKPKSSEAMRREMGERETGGSTRRGQDEPESCLGRTVARKQKSGEEDGMPTDVTPKCFGGPMPGSLDQVRGSPALGEGCSTAGAHAVTGDVVREQGLEASEEPGAHREGAVGTDPQLSRSTNRPEQRGGPQREVLADEDATAIEKGVSFMGRKQETVLLGPIAHHSGAKGEFAVATQTHSIRPDELAEAHERVKTRDKLSEK
ncbi:predicted protein [Postia placenta Mad-698-R]|nr:predicted protein [Postia placenta Mad-698-R]